MNDASEQLWISAHDHIGRGELALAVRELAQCFALLEAANDPRLYEVHKRWIEVHAMYVAASAPPAHVALKDITGPQSAMPPSDKEPVSQRLRDVVDQQRREADRTTSQAKKPAKTDGKSGSEADWSKISFDGPVGAPAMALEDAPVVMVSLDLLISLELPPAFTPAPSDASDVVFLEGLLARVQANRRPSA